MKLGRLVFPTFLLIILSCMTWVMITNYQRVDELQKAGKEPLTVATPGRNGEDGPPGKSAYDIWRDNGYRGSELDFLQWLRGSRGPAGRDGQSIRGEVGPQGEQGLRGPAGNDGASIRGEKGDRGDAGPIGPRGETGPVGAPGASGRTPVIGCVIRTVNSLPVNYIAWKYTDEADGAYRNLYRVPAWAQAEGCVEVAA
ncbi:hypothetical protein [Dietzia maris]|uniref:hypothetical protein n=1 Tax=Dietzia maris TaxID=37915 RepID=UPI0037C9ACC9